VTASNLQWYACVYESEKRIIYGRAPVGSEEAILEHIKSSLRFHKLIGLQSKIYLSPARLPARAIYDFCETRAARGRGDYHDYVTTKLDLRWNANEVSNAGGNSL